LYTRYLGTTTVRFSIRLNFFKDDFFGNIFKVPSAPTLKCSIKNNPHTTPTYTTMSDCLGNYEEHFKKYLKDRCPEEMTPMPMANVQENVGGGGAPSCGDPKQKNSAEKVEIDPGLVHSGNCSPGCSCYRKLGHCRDWIDYEAPECHCKKHAMERNNGKTEEKK
jgi:hypothetical protein